jgi:conjugal transfer/type IV secretion protein DotA/TraY
MNTTKLLAVLGRIASLGRFLPYMVTGLYWLTMAAVVYLIAGLFAPAAFAQTATESPGLIDFTSIRQAATQGGDWSMALWKDVLGPFFADPFGQAGMPTTTLGFLFLTFNACVFTVAVAYLGWGVLSGIVGTTQDGSPMGQRMNSSWYPIRVVTGVGSAMPLFGGMTLGQAVLAYLAVAGIGTANLMLIGVVKLDGMVQLTGSGHISGAPGVGVAEVAKTVEALTRSQICVQSAQRLGRQYKEAGVLIHQAN